MTAFLMGIRIENDSLGSLRGREGNTDERYEGEETRKGHLVGCLVIDEKQGTSLRYGRRRCTS